MQGGRGQGGMMSYKEVWWLEKPGKRKKIIENQPEKEQKDKENR